MTASPTRAFRLHSTIPEVPGIAVPRTHSAAYLPNAKPHWFPRLNQALKERLRANFDSARSLTERLEQGRLDKLKNAPVIADNQILSWSEYMALQDHGEGQSGNMRVHHFIERLMAAPGKTVQAALEVTVGEATKPPYISQSRGTFRTLVTMEDIDIGGGIVRPQVNVDYDALEHHQSEFRNLFRHQGDHLLVTGYFRLHRVTGKKNPVYFVRADIARPELIAPFDYKAIVARARAADERRATRAWLKPYRFGA